MTWGELKKRVEQLDIPDDMKLVLVSVDYLRTLSDIDIVPYYPPVLGLYFTTEEYFAAEGDAK